MKKIFMFLAVFVLLYGGGDIYAQNEYEPGVVLLKIKDPFTRSFTKNQPENFSKTFAEFLTQKT